MKLPGWQQKDFLTSDLKGIAQQALQHPQCAPAARLQQAQGT